MKFLKLLKKFIPTFIKSAVRKYLFKTNKIDTPINCRNVENPLKALAISENKPVLVEVPVGKLRGLGPMGFRLLVGESHPFIETAQSILEGVCKKYRGSKLEEYYQLCQPQNVGEALGINPNQDPVFLFEPYAFVLPWSGKPNKQQLKIVWNRADRENRQHGSSVRGKEGFQLFGPVSDAKGELEFKRIKEVSLSIKDKGYLRNNGPNGDIEGRLLVSSGKFVVLISGGQHRAAAAVANGYDKLPVRLGSKNPTIINPKYIQNWPGVKSGVYTARSAHAVFNRIMEGTQPDFYNRILKKDR